MPSAHSADALAIECYLRGTSLVEPVDATIETLRDHERSGLIDTFILETWPDEVVISGNREATTAEARYRRFQTWADQADASLDPAFSVDERTTLTDDDPRTVLTLPVCCLAVSVNDVLELVAPHKTEDTTYGVEDVLEDLDALDQDDTERSESTETGPTPATSSDDDPPDRCPACDEPLVTGQGVYACRSCSWSGLSYADRTIEESSERADREPGPPTPEAE